MNYQVNNLIIQLALPLSPWLFISWTPTELLQSLIFETMNKVAASPGSSDDIWHDVGPYAPGRYTIRDVAAVLPGRVLPRASVHVENGVIVDIREDLLAGPLSLDGRGLVLMPGLVDLHTDIIERTAQPRPGVTMPADVALAAAAGELTGAGVTTAFHGVAFASTRGRTRDTTVAHELVQVLTVRHRARPLGDHRLLLRLELHSPSGWDVLEQLRSLAIRPDRAAVAWQCHPDVSPPENSPVPRLGRLSSLARDLGVRVLAHDLTTADEVDAARAAGAAIAEFPTTRDAAAAARTAGLPVVMGAPNVLRGGSHTGNVSALDLVAAGLCTALASDYLPASMLCALPRLVDAVGLPSAARLLTTGPADAAGLTDRGRLAVGARADLLLADLSGSVPAVRGVWHADPSESGPSIAMSPG